MARPAEPVPAVGKGDPLVADLVLEGGGVKGIGLAGAIDRLAESGYRFERIAGTSAGAITGAFVAAMVQSGHTVAGIDDIAREIDYGSFRDATRLERWSGPLRPLAEGVNLMLESGVYPGDYLHDWIADLLAGYGIHTFGDLRLPDDPDSDLPEAHRYRLVVMASDVSRQRAIRLPWDYHLYGLDPDEQSVADAVRMSAGIPFYFEPVTLRDRAGEVSTIVDGGLFSNYPVTIFDRTDGRPPRWPTFGVRLSARQERPHTERVKGPISLALACVESLFGAWDAMYIDNPCTIARSIFVDTGQISATDFDIGTAKQEWLLEQGRKAAGKFLDRWSYADYLRSCGGVVN